MCFCSRPQWFFDPSRRPKMAPPGKLNPAATRPQLRPVKAEPIEETEQQCGVGVKDVRPASAVTHIVKYTDSMLNKKRKKAPRKAKSAAQSSSSSATISAKTKARLKEEKATRRAERADRRLLKVDKADRREAREVERRDRRLEKEALRLLKQKRDEQEQNDAQNQTRGESEGEGQTGGETDGQEDSSAAEDFGPPIDGELGPEKGENLAEFIKRWLFSRNLQVKGTGINHLVRNLEHPEIPRGGGTVMRSRKYIEWHYAKELVCFHISGEGGGEDGVRVHADAKPPKLKRLATGTQTPGAAAKQIRPRVTTFNPSAKVTAKPLLEVKREDEPPTQRKDQEKRAAGPSMLPAAKRGKTIEARATYGKAVPMVKPLLEVKVDPGEVREDKVEPGEVSEAVPSGESSPVAEPEPTMQRQQWNDGWGSAWQGPGWSEEQWQDKADDKGWGEENWQDKPDKGWGEETWQDKADDKGWGEEKWQDKPDKGWGEETWRDKADDKGWGEEKLQEKPDKRWGEETWQDKPGKGWSEKSDEYPGPWRH